MNESSLIALSEIQQLLNTYPEGLQPSNVEERLNEYGKNELTEKKEKISMAAYCTSV